MSRLNFQNLFLIGAAVLASSAAFGQGDIQFRARQLPGWDARTREGRCEVRVWVDNRAEVRMRGDQIFVHTLEGSKSRDEGSECSQPLPYNSVSNFQIRQVAGRSRVNLTQEPSRMNNYTALVNIEDLQGGGDNYAFEVTWRAEPNIATATAPAPFFDDVRACQDMVRQRFLSQNGRGSYIDFETFAQRQRQGQNQNQYQNQNSNQYQNQDQGRNGGQPQYNNRNPGRETIQGRGSARSYNESRDLSYTCVVDTQRSQVMSGVYQLSTSGYRTNERSRLR
jgi:hypothetical protein